MARPSAREWRQRLSVVWTAITAPWALPPASFDRAPEEAPPFDSPTPAAESGASSSAPSQQAGPTASANPTNPTNLATPETSENSANSAPQAEHRYTYPGDPRARAKAPATWEASSTLATPTDSATTRDISRIEHALVALAEHAERLNARLADLEQHVHTHVHTLSGIARAEDLAELRTGNERLEREVTELRALIAAVNRPRRSPLPLAPPSVQRYAAAHAARSAANPVDLDEPIAMLPPGLFGPHPAE